MNIHTIIIRGQTIQNLVWRISAHTVGWGLDGPVGSVDDGVAPGEILDAEASPGVCLVCPGVDVEPAVQTRYTVSCSLYQAGPLHYCASNVHQETVLVRSSMFCTDTNSSAFH